MTYSTPTRTTPRASRGRWAWSWWIILLPLALIPLLAMRPAEHPERTLGPLPQCAGDARSQMTLVVFDVSGSVIDGDGADPRGRSFDESRLLARALADQPCTPDDRMGAVIFASTSVEVPPIPLTSLSVIEAAIKRPPTSEIGGGTNLSGALALVNDMTGRYPDHDITVILLSDMQVDNPAAITAQLQRLAGHSLHLVGLGLYDPRFDSLFDTVTPLTDEVGRGDVGEALAEAVAQSREDPTR